MMDMMLAAHAVLQQAHHIYSLQSARGKTASHLLYMYRYSISSLHSLHHHSPLIYTVICSVILCSRFSIPSRSYVLYRCTYPSLSLNLLQYHAAQYAAFGHALEQDAGVNEPDACGKE